MSGRDAESVPRHKLGARGETRSDGWRPRELPIEGAPADVVKIVESYGEWLAADDLRKLFINANPGAQIVGRMRDFCRGWPNQREVTVPGIHFIQEDSPDQIGAAVREFVGSFRR